MPGRDGTGPMGVGPAEWGRGGCAGPRGGFGFRGRGFGFDPGGGAGYRAVQQLIPDAGILEAQAELLERQAAACRAMARKARGAEQKED